VPRTALDFDLLKQFKLSIASSKMSGLEIGPAIEAIIITCVTVSLDAADFCARQIVRGLQLYELYGPSGTPLLLFGNRTIWRIQAQTLGRVNDDDALAFKKSVYDECTMIAVAVRTAHADDLSPTNDDSLQSWRR
jgi:hypothetical protein